MTKINFPPLGLGMRDGEMMKIIKQNTKIPTQRTWESDLEVRNIDRIRFPILEGERLLAKSNNELARIVLETKYGAVV